MYCGFGVHGTHSRRLELQHKIGAMVALDAERVRTIQALRRRIAAGQATVETAKRRRDVARGEAATLSTALAAAEKSCRTLELRVRRRWWLWCLAVCDGGGGGVCVVSWSFFVAPVSVLCLPSLSHLRWSNSFLFFCHSHPLPPTTLPCRVSWCVFDWHDMA